MKKHRFQKPVVAGLVAAGLIVSAGALTLGSYSTNRVSFNNVSLGNVRPTEFSIFGSGVFEENVSVFTDRGEFVFNPAIIGRYARDPGQRIDYGVIDRGGIYYLDRNGWYYNFEDFVDADIEAVRLPLEDNGLPVYLGLSIKHRE